MNNTTKPDKKYYTGITLLILLFGTIIFVLNRFYPLWADDWVYSFIWEIDGNISQRIGSVSDIVQSQYIHYLRHGGRTVVHVIAQTLLTFSPFMMDLINTLAYIAFCLIIYKISAINNKKSLRWFFFINILIWFYQPEFAHTILWITGSANYLWGTMIIIGFLYFYCEYFLGAATKNSSLKSVFLFIGGVIAGWTNENTVAGMLVLIGLIIAYKLYRKEKIPVWVYVGLAGAVIGYLLLVLAPGNYVRYETALVHDNIVQESKVTYYLKRFMPVVGDFYNFALPLVFIYAIVLATYIYLEPNKNKKVIILSLFFIIAAIVADLVMVASPAFPARAWFGILTFIIIAIGIIYANINTQTPYFKALVTIVIVFCSINFVISFQKNFKDLYNVNKVIGNREEVINQQENKADFDFIVNERINPKTKFPDIDEIPSDSTYSTFWVNKAFTKFHGIKSFKIE